MRRAASAKKNARPEAPEQTISDGLSARQKALVFISHDGRDADLAEAFADLLSDVSAGTLKSFRSSDKKGNTGIEFGAEWYAAIMSQLSDATDVVALLTPQSLDRPWILYEAGVAKGKLETTVLGVALGVPLERVSAGPFGQFQNCADDEDTQTRLVMQLLEKNPDAAPREEAVRVQVRMFRNKVAKLLQVKGRGQADKDKAEEPNVAKLFEEVKAMVRELPDRVDGRVRDAANQGGLRRLRRVDPMMLEEILYHPRMRKEDKNSAASWLLFVSLLRDDVPWLYEPGMELYRALRSGKHAEIRKSISHFQTVLELTSRSSIFHELSMGDKFSFMFIRHLPEITERFLVETQMRISGDKVASQNDDEPE